MRCSAASRAFGIRKADHYARAFAAKAPQKVIESMSVWTTSEYHAIVEEDQTITIASTNNRNSH